MSARVTMRDVARKAGVSTMTVSRSLRSDGAVNAKTRQAVKEVAASLGYVYDGTAQTFRAQRSGFVALALPSINNANFAATHQALTSSLAKTEMQLLLGITNYDVQEEERMIQQLLARRPEAVILTGGTHTDNTRQLLDCLTVPVFEIWDLPRDPIGHAIGFSNFDVMALLVEHLAEQGCRKFGFVGASGNTDTRGNERWSGAIMAAKELGLPPIVGIETGPAPATMTKSAGAIQDKFDVVRSLDALLCVSDPVAFGAIMALEKLGLRIPEDVAVTGFGNFEISQISRPSITTLDVGAKQIGTLTGKLTIETLFSEERASPPIYSPIVPRLIVRDSSRIVPRAF